MRIDPQLPGHVPARQVQAPPGNSRETQSSHSGEQVASSHTPSPELKRLADELQRTPEVRAALLDHVSKRLESGYYLTDAAAQKTAEVMLHSDE